MALPTIIDATPTMLVTFKREYIDEFNKFNNKIKHAISTRRRRTPLFGGIATSGAPGSSG